MKYILSAFADEASPKLSEQIDAMKANGVTHLEIRGVNGKNISSLSLQETRECAKMLSDSGIKVWSIGSPIGKIKITDDFAAHMDCFKRLLEAADILGAKAFRLFSFYEAYSEFNEVVDRLGAMCEVADGSGIVLCHENEKDIYGDVAERCLELLNALPSLSAVFDPANFIQCGVDIEKAWALLKDKVYYLHIKDATESGIVVPSGKGVGKLEFVVKDFLASGERTVSIEPHLADFVGFSALEQDEKSALGFTYKNNFEAFSAAVSAFKAIADN